MKRKREQQANGDGDNDDDLHRSKKVVKTIKARDSSWNSDHGNDSKLQKEDAENHTISEDSKLKKEERDENPHMDDQDSLQEPQDIDDGNIEDEDREELNGNASSDDDDNDNKSASSVSSVIQPQEYLQLCTRNPQNEARRAPPGLNDGIKYVSEVETAFANEEGNFQKFLDIIQDFKAICDAEHQLNLCSQCNFIHVISRLWEIMKGHDTLILGLNRFLPEEYELRIG